LPEAVAKLFTKTGAPALAQLVAAQGNEVVLQALRTLNRAEGDDKVPSSKDLEAALDTLHGLATHEDTDDLAKSLAKLLDWSSRIYGGAMCMLQIVGAFNNVKTWTRKVGDAEKQPEALRRWLAKPTSMSLLAKALATLRKEDQKKKGGKRTKLLETDSSADATSDTGSGDDTSDSSSSSPVAKKKKAKKDSAKSKKQLKKEARKAKKEAAAKAAKAKKEASKAEKAAKKKKHVKKTPSPSSVSSDASSAESEQKSTGPVTGLKRGLETSDPEESDSPTKAKKESKSKKDKAAKASSTAAKASSASTAASTKPSDHAPQAAAQRHSTALLAS
jgi:hypothetical protein